MVVALHLVVHQVEAPRDAAVLLILLEAQLEEVLAVGQLRVDFDVLANDENRRRCLGVGVVDVARRHPLAVVHGLLEGYLHRYLATKLTLEDMTLIINLCSSIHCRQQQQD